MTSKTLMAGVCAFIVALVVVAVVFAVFGRSEPVVGDVAPAPAEEEGGAQAQEGKPLVDVLWKSDGAGKARKEPAEKESGEVKKAPDATSGPETD